MSQYERYVFINCPFDESFEPLFRAIILTVRALGFVPRCAREWEGEAEPRILRIARGLAESKYSIHDLSRFQGEGPDNLARLNMPLELGMAMGIQYLRALEGLGRHNWLHLTPRNFLHNRFVSDLSGYDGGTHEGTPATVIGSVAAWLKVQPEASSSAPAPAAILNVYPVLCKLLERARQDSLGSLTWPETIEVLSRGRNDRLAA